MTITYSSVVEQAKQAQQFLDDRRSAGLPVPSKDQLRRAERLLASNPTLRQQRTPLGVQLAALGMPTTRHDRARERARLRAELDAEGADREAISAKIAALELKPARTRGEHLRVEASPEAIKAFVDAYPHMDAMEASEAISAMHGYRQGPRGAVARVARHLRSPRAGRMPRHVREKAVMLSAIAQATALVVERQKANADG